MSAVRVGAVVASLLAFASGCGGSSDEQTVTYQNATDGVVRVAVDGVEVASIEAGGTAEVRVSRELMPDHIEAFDTDGNVLVDQEVIWDDLEAGDWQIVIQ